MVKCKKKIWNDIVKPCKLCGFCPYGRLNDFPTTDTKYSCRVFGHDCPVFYHAEPLYEENDLIQEDIDAMDKELGE